MHSCDFLKGLVTSHPLIDGRNCTGPVSNVVDFLPILQHLPGPLRCRARALHQRLVDTYGGLIKQINLKVREGVPFRDCLAKTMLMDKSGDHMDHLDMTMLASAFLIGGVETVSLSRCSLYVENDGSADMCRLPRQRQ